jgi:hypothetical protein
LFTRTSVRPNRSTASLRAEAGRSPDDRELTGLIGELTTRSERFSARWATHNVRSSPAQPAAVRDETSEDHPA